MSTSRLAPARRRASVAKIALGVASAATFAVALTLARVSHAGVAKPVLRSLAAPASFVAVVRQDQLQAGILAPANAPPGAATSVS